MSYSNKLSILVDDLLESLSARPEEWWFDNYAAEHKSGLRVWLANKYYGVGIHVPKPNGTFSYHEIGGVTGWSAFFGRWIPWRRRLFDAFVAERGRREGAPVLDRARSMLVTA